MSLQLNMFHTQTEVSKILIKKAIAKMLRPLALDYATGGLLSYIKLHFGNIEANRNCKCTLSNMYSLQWPLLS